MNAWSGALDGTGNVRMASDFSHAVAALSIGTCFYRPGIPKRLWIAGAVCSAIPDADVIGFGFGIHYGDFWGHRGFTHSLLFAALLGVFVIALGFRDKISSASRFYLWAYLFLATASHGLLDSMTDGASVSRFSPRLTLAVIFFRGGLFEFRPLA